MKLMRKVFEVDEKEMAALTQYSEGFGAGIAIKRKLWDPACNILIEDYPVGAVSARYGVWATGLHIAVKGKVQVEYWSSYGMGQWVKGKFTAEAGDAYLLDKGDQIRFSVIGDEPYRHLGILMPAHPYAAPPSPENRPPGETAGGPRTLG